MVGRGAGAGSTTCEMEIFVASAVYLSGRYWRVSLHGLDVGPFDRLVVDQVIGSNPQHLVDLATVFRRAPGAWTLRTRVAGNF